MDWERRTWTEDVEIRMDTDGKPGIAGVAAPIGQWSEVRGAFRERFAPGSFSGALKESDARALFNHNPDNLLGRESAGTLEITETKRALKFVVPELPDTAIGQTVRIGIERGDIQGNSFAFRIADGGDVWEEGPDGIAQRTVTNVAELLDVGPVTNPFYEKGTSISKRSLEQADAVHHSPPIKRMQARQRLAETEGSF